MKRFIYWIKSNPIATGLAVVALASIGVLVYVHVKGGALKQELQQRYEDTSRKISSLSKTSVVIPPEKPDGSTRTVQITVNEPAIKQLQEVYGKLDQEYSDIFADALRINKGEVAGTFRHLPMLEGLFPNFGDDPAKPWDARFKYRDAFKEMLMSYSPSPTYPRLNAGMPPGGEEINDALARVEQEFLSKIFPIKKLEELTQQERMDLHKQKSAKLQDLYKSRASQISVYAVTDIASADCPFDIGKWSEFGSGGKRPEMEDIWEGQMGLWIQQDLVAAIAMTNQVGQPGSNVMNQPVKRLVSIRVVPGYVGLDTPGAITSDAPTAQAAGYATAEQERAVVEGAVASGEARLLDDFSKAPTGRRSNTIYDVRHVWLTVDAEYQRLPEFFDNIAKVNFMTVLKMSIEDMDEYKAWKDGFVFGSGDTVRVTLLIESIWLRDWTKELMPKEVQLRLGIIKPEAPPAQ